MSEEKNMTQFNSLSYQDGKFIEIVEPLEKGDDFCEEIKNSGYRKWDEIGGAEFPCMEIYYSYEDEKKEYQYFILADLCSCGHTVFFKKWYDVLDFINKFGALSLATELKYIKEEIEDLKERI